MLFPFQQSWCLKQKSALALSAALVCRAQQEANSHRVPPKLVPEGGGQDNICGMMTSLAICQLLFKVFCKGLAGGMHNANKDRDGNTVVAGFLHQTSPLWLKDGQSKLTFVSLTVLYYAAVSVVMMRLIPVVRSLCGKIELGSFISLAIKSRQNFNRQLNCS